MFEGMQRRRTGRSTAITALFVGFTISAQVIGTMAFMTEHRRLELMLVDLNLNILYDTAGSDFDFIL